MPHIFLRTGLVVLTVIALGGCTNQSGMSFFQPQNPNAMPAAASLEPSGPGLIVSNEPPPSVIFRPGSRDSFPGSDNAGTDSYRAIPSLSSQHMETPVTVKAAELDRDLAGLQSNVENMRQQLDTLQTNDDAESASYYALVASISSDLQSGTTSGNPILVERWNTAQDKLNAISQTTGSLSTLPTELANMASRASFLLESVHGALALSGAVDEDHKKLAVIEDGVNEEIVAVNRLMTRVNAEINRRSAYLRTERANLQTLSLAISNGELYGQNLTNTVFKKAADSIALTKAAAVPVAPATRRPLVIIRFDHPNVNYDKPLYTAINQALEKYPAAKFDLVAVSPSEGNAAKLAMGSTAARKNGEAVLRSLTQMGLPVERIHLNAASSKNVLNSEVHIYLQ